MTQTPDTEHTPVLAGEPGSGAIFLAMLDETDDHFLVTFDRPGRIEIGLVHTDDGRTRILAHAYEGSEVDVNQEPVLAYDGTQVLAPGLSAPSSDL